MTARPVSGKLAGVMFFRGGSDMATHFGQRLGLSRMKSRALSLAFAGLVLVSSFPTFAQPASCDPRYWDSMKAKAWLEAQREIAQNQNLIYKPDSVLEYTCFDEFLNHLSQVVHVQHRLFSQTIEWGTITGPNMQAALSDLVGNALVPYITANFGHNYLGGRGNAAAGNGAIGPVASRNYACVEMDAVWQQAKCLNFIQQAPVNRTARDDFFNLSWFASNDPRDLPSACTADARWGLNTNLAFNSGGGGYVEEAFLTYSSHFATAGCPAAAIPTGVLVRRQNYADYNEFVCINPGCAYVPTGMNAGNCTQAGGNPPAR
jgi:hypothetical protein